jgi:hypothetical protein
MECGRTLDTVQKLQKTLETRHRANLVQKNDRNGHERTTAQGDTQKAGHPEEANLQLQPRKQSAPVGRHAGRGGQAVRHRIWNSGEARQSLQSA